MKHCSITIAILLVWLGITAQAYTIDEISRADRILHLIDQRLRISVLVARAKWNENLPIEAAGRESVVVANFEELARDKGIPSELARSFIEAQIVASKLVQTELFAAWRADRRVAFAVSPDLKGEIRPQLDLLTKSLIEALQAYHEVEGRDFQLLLWRAELLWGEQPGPARRAALRFTSPQPKSAH